MREHKILVTGSVGAGKTTAIGLVSEVAPVVTDVRSSDASIDKARTTVGLDYGQLTLDNGDIVRLFGTPGQARFDFLWKILARNALGLIVLMDNSRPDPLADLCVYLDGFAEHLRTLPCVVGVGRMQSHAVPTLDDYADRLASTGRVFPILDVDVRRRSDVLVLIDTLLMQLEADMRKDEE
ncbi:GTP-binding protein [Variovorax sp. 160MFSha2.1]|uniref:GTP-binding protein n=1 Tax=Variovorax sp. 160MFSha2.1 TaxID=3158367 RepID=UPI003AAAD2A7